MATGEKGSVDPRRPHRFRLADEGIAQVMSGSWVESSQANVIGGTAAYRRSLRCAVPGCGRPQTDPIHGADEGDEAT